MKPYPSFRMVSFAMILNDFNKDFKVTILFDVK